MSFDVRPILMQTVAFIDFGIFKIIEVIYGLFFAVSRVELFTGTVIVDFFNRIQLIIGVFVLFQLVATVLKGIVNPDNFMDSKGGAKNLVTRILTALVILTLIVPFNIRNVASNSFAEKVNEHGLLFGTLYSLQTRILSNNTIGTLIFGWGGNEDRENSLIPSGYDSEDTGVNKNGQMVNTDIVKKAQNSFRSTVTMKLIRAFYRVKEENPCSDKDTKAEYKKQEKLTYDQIKKRYDEANTPDEIQSLVGYQCKNSKKDKELIFEYTPIAPIIVSLLLIAIFVSFTFDVVVRAAKLAILRIVAPIPIISYMNPSGSDNSFDAWTKLLISTYVDLFVRIATVYFALFLSVELFENHSLRGDNTGALGLITLLIVFIGLLMFAKQAPKFFREALGLKGDPGSLFGGLKDALAIGSLAAAPFTGAAAGALAGKGFLGRAGGAAKGFFGGALNSGKTYLSNGDKIPSFTDANNSRKNYQQQLAMREMTNEPRKSLRQRMQEELLGYNTKDLASEANQKVMKDAIDYKKKIDDAVKKDKAACVLSDDFKSNLDLDPVGKATGKERLGPDDEIDYNVVRSVKQWNELYDDYLAKGYTHEQLRNLEAAKNYANQMVLSRVTSSDPASLTDANDKDIYENANKLLTTIKNNKHSSGFDVLYNDYLSAAPTVSTIDYGANASTLYKTLCTTANDALNVATDPSIESDPVFLSLSEEQKQNVRVELNRMGTFAVTTHENFINSLKADTTSMTISSAERAEVGLGEEISYGGRSFDLRTNHSLQEISNEITELKGLGAPEDQIKGLEKLFDIKASERVANASAALASHYNTKLDITSDNRSAISLSAEEKSSNAIMHEGKKFVDLSAQQSISELNAKISELQIEYHNTTDVGKRANISTTMHKIEQLRDAKEAEQNVRVPLDAVQVALKTEVDAGVNSSAREFNSLKKDVVKKVADSSAEKRDDISKIGSTLLTKDVQSELSKALSYNESIHSGIPTSGSSSSSSSGSSKPKSGK